MSEHKATYHRFPRGTVWPGRPVYGYKVKCSCGWTKRVNGAKREAESFHRDHREEGSND